MLRKTKKNSLCHCKLKNRKQDGNRRTRRSNSLMLFLKAFKDCAELILSGIEFHNFGAMFLQELGRNSMFWSLVALMLVPLSLYLLFLSLSSSPMLVDVCS